MSRGSKGSERYMLLPLETLKNSDFVIIDCGINDLLQGVPPLTVSCALVDFAKSLLANPTVPRRHIILCSAIPAINRTSTHPGAVDVTHFCVLKNICNISIQTCQYGFRHKVIYVLSFHLHNYFIRFKQLVCTARRSVNTH